MSNELMYVGDEAAEVEYRATDPAAAGELVDGMPADPGPMMLGKGSWRYVRWGSNATPVVAYVVGVQGEAVQVKIPNAWAAAANDERAGWTRTLAVELGDVVAERVPSTAVVAALVGRLGVPERLVERERVEREVGQ